MRQILQGHYWTIAPWILQKLRPLAQEPSTSWSTITEDPTVGAVRLRGRIRHREGSKSLLLVVHGLGGNSGSHYVLHAAAAAERAGLACLRLELRGAGGFGEDFYHAGLFADLAAAIASPEVSRYERIHILGYSLGGHIALRYAASEGRDPRVRSVAAICSPLDLDRSAAAIDRPERWVYRRHILTGLKAMYLAVAAQRALPVFPADALAIQSIRAWDGRIVAPRYGFPSAEAYYAQESAASRLRHIAIPSLLIAAEADPMVPADTVRPALREASSLLDVRWIPLGGHVGFPGSLDLGLGARSGLEGQVIHWLVEHDESGPSAPG